MRSFILIFSSILLFSCTSQKNVSIGNDTTSSKVANKGMKMYGKIVVKSTPSEDGKSEMPALCFDNGTTYAISFLESNVSKDEVQKYAYKNIDIIGEIKLKHPSTTKNQTKRAPENTQEDDDPYVVIYKIIN